MREHAKWCTCLGEWASYFASPACSCGADIANAATLAERARCVALIRKHGNRFLSTTRAAIVNVADAIEAGEETK